MATFKVVHEITVNADSPLQAAKTVQKWFEDAKTDWQFYVQEVGNKKIVSVDLAEHDSETVLPVEKYEPMIKR
jgi:hypothetical protein